MPKWEKGGRIDDPRTVINFILEGDVVFDGHKPQNSGWLQNLSIREIVNRTRHGYFSIALPTKRNAPQ